MEASSGIDKEDVEHAIDGTLNTSTTIVNGIARRYLNTSYPTFQHAQIFSIQPINCMITLLSTGVDAHTIASYIHIGSRKDKVPIILEKNYMRFRMMELLMILMSR
jgi:hypothetical protein